MNVTKFSFNIIINKMISVYASGGGIDMYLGLLAVKMSVLNIDWIRLK